jgi:preprotein translocase subunit YajC
MLLTAAACAPLFLEMPAFNPSWMLWIFIAAIWIFVLIVPQRKEAKRRTAMQEGLKRGDEVLTQSGIIGRIAQNKGEKVTLDCDGAKITFLRSTIVKVIDAKEGAAEEAKDKDKEKKS